MSEDFERLNRLFSPKLLGGFSHHPMCTDFAKVVETVANPDWGEGGHIHNWKTYVPDELQEIWLELPAAARIVAFLFAESQAWDEEWD